MMRLRAAAGMRAGVNWLNTATYEMDTSISGKVWNEFISKTNVTFLDTTGNPDAVPLTLSDKKTGLYGEVAGQTNFTAKATGWSGFLNSTVRFNDTFTTFSGRGGVRYQF
jgi:hypothetical protein